MANNKTNINMGNMMTKNGEYTELHSNGMLWKRMNYLNGELHGPFEAFHVIFFEHHDGKHGNLLKTYGNFVNGKPQGIWTEWSKSGQPIQEENYVEGQLQESTQYYWTRREGFGKGGQVKSRRNYLNGKIHGLEEEWYEDGRLKSKKIYFNGKLHGVSERWYDSRKLDEKYHGGSLNLQGQLEKKEVWVNDSLHGPRRTWYPSGHIHKKENYVDSKGHGFQEWISDPSNPGVSRRGGEFYGVMGFINGEQVNNQKYQSYRNSIQISLDKIIQIRDLAKFTYAFL